MLVLVLSYTLPRAPEFVHTTRNSFSFSYVCSAKNHKSTAVPYFGWGKPSIIFTSIYVVIAW